MKTFFIVLVLIKISTAQIPDRVKIEAQLANVTNDLIKSEAKLVKKLSSFYYQAKYCSSNLKASNLSTNFTDVLDNMMATVQQIQIMNDHENASNIPMDLISSYDYCQFRIATTFSDIKHYKAVIEVIQANETRLSEYGGNVTSNYISNYKIFMKLKSKDKTVMATIRQVLNTFSDFGAYIQTLTTHVGNLMRLNSYLSELIVSKEISPPPNSTVDPFMASIRDVESKLVPCQEQVLTYVKFDLMKIGIALKTVTAGSTKQPVTQKSILSSLKETLLPIANVNDYSLVGWPQLPDLPKNGGSKITLKLRSQMCKDKKRNFEIFVDAAKKNQSRIEEGRTALNESTASVTSARKVGLAQVMTDVVSATLKVEALYENYIKSLRFAIEEIQDLEDSLEPTTVLTTSTIPLTTSTTTSTSTVPTTTSSTSTSTTSTTVPTTSSTTTSTSTTTTTPSTTTTSIVPTTTSSTTTTSTTPTTTTTTSTVPTTTTSTTSTTTTTTTSTTPSTTTPTTSTTSTSTTTLTPTTTSSTSTTTSSTTTVLTTTIAVNSSLCSITQRFNNSNGVYRKTICIRHSNINFNAGQDFCKSIGMTQFAIETAEDLTQLFALSSPNYSPYHHFFVNGQQAANGSWFVNTTQVKPLYSAIIPTDITGPCLMYTTELPAPITKTKGVSCFLATFVLCEYF